MRPGDLFKPAWFIDDEKWVIVLIDKISNSRWSIWVDGEVCIWNTYDIKRDYVHIM